MKKAKRGNNKIISVTVRFPPEIHEELSKISSTETRSINQQILHFVKHGLRAIKHCSVIEEKLKKETAISEGEAREKKEAQ